MQIQGLCLLEISSRGSGTRPRNQPGLLSPEVKCPHFIVGFYNGTNGKASRSQSSWGGLWVGVAGGTGCIIVRAQCEMKMWTPYPKMMKDFKMVQAKI